MAYKKNIKKMGSAIKKGMKRAGAAQKKRRIQSKWGVPKSPAERSYKAKGARKALTRNALKMAGATVRSISPKRKGKKK